VPGADAVPLWPGACPRGRDLIAESGGGGADARGASLRPALRATLSRATPLLDLPSVDVGVTSARIVGHGLKASADIFFSNCETVTFDSLRDILNPTVLKGEITLATGAMPKVTVETGQRILALLRRMAERQQALTDDEDAIEWGVTYLHSARPEECDMADRQEERWRAFSDFKRLDEDAQGEGRPPFHVRVVLVDSGGRRYIRSQLFCDYVGRRRTRGRGTTRRSSTA